MKRFFKFNNSSNGGSLKNKETKKTVPKEVNQEPLSRVSSISDSSSAWGSNVNLNLQFNTAYRIDTFSIKGFTKLHKASWTGNINKLKKYSKKINVNLQDENGRTALHLACAQAHADIVSFLINCDANLELRDCHGNTPLLVAIISHHIDICVILLDHGADPNSTNSKGQSGLHLVATSGFIDAVPLLVSKHGADINATNDENNTPLYLSTCLRNIEMVKLFLRLEADVNAVNENKKTCIMVACEEGFDDLVELFLDYKAITGAVEEQGLTCEEIARQAHNDRCIELLRKYNVNSQPANEINFLDEGDAKDSNSWNDDFSDILPLEKQPVHSTLDFSRFDSLIVENKNKEPLEEIRKSPSASPLKQLPSFEDENFNSNTKETPRHDSFKQVKLPSLEEEIFKPSAESIQSSNSLKQNKLTSFEDENIPPNKQVGLEVTTLITPQTHEASKNRELLSDLGLSDISDSLTNEDSSMKEQNYLPSSIKMTRQDELKLAPPQFDSPLEYVDTDEESGSIKEELKFPYDSGTIDGDDATLGRIGTMQQVDELWEKNSTVAPEQEDNADLYHANLAVVNSKESTIERDKSAGSELIESGVLINEDVVLWDEMMKQLFGNLNGDEESNSSSNNIPANDEYKDNSLKDLTFQEVSSADEPTHSVQEDRLYLLLTRLLIDSSNNEKILTLFQRLRASWAKEQIKCQSLASTNSFLKAETSKLRSKLDNVNSIKAESEEQLHRVQSELELFRHRLDEEDAKRTEVELNFKKSEEHLEKLENKYLAEVNLRQEAQMALRASKEELRAANEIVVEQVQTTENLIDNSTQTEEQRDEEKDEEITQLYEENKTLQLKLNKKQEQFDDIENEKRSTSIKIKELKEQLEKENDTLSNLRSELSNIPGLKQSLTEKETEILELRMELKSLNQENIVLNNKLNQSNQQQEKLLSSAKSEDETKKMFDDHLIHCSSQINILKNDLDAMTVNYNVCRADLDRVKKLNEIYENSQKSLQNKWEEMLASLQEKYDLVNKDLLQHRENSLQEKAKLMGELNDLRVQKSESELKLNGTKRENQQLCEMLSKVEANLQERIQEIIVADSKVRSMSLENSILLKRMKHFTEREKEMEDELNICKKDLHHLEKLKDEVTQLQSEKRNLEETAEKYIKLKSQFQNLQDENFKCLGAKSSFCTEIENLKLEKEQKQQKISKLESEISRMLEEFTAVSGEIEDFKKKLNLETEQNQKLKNQIQQLSKPFHHCADVQSNQQNKCVNEEVKPHSTRCSHFSTGSCEFLPNPEFNLFRKNLEMQCYVELNEKLEQINRFLENQSRAAEQLELIHSRNFSQLQLAYQTAIQNFNTEIGRLQAYAKEKESCHTELEEYDHLRKLLKAKSRIKKKLVQSRSISYESHPILINNHSFKVKDYTSFLKSSQPASSTSYWDARK